jgi:S-adenosylmethionine:tRNA ribosyltransferase-isomerase
MKPARAPRSDKWKVKLMVVQGTDLIDTTVGRLDEYLRPGDLLVVNDAATLPASLHGRSSSGDLLEVRLTAQATAPEDTFDDRRWRAVLFGAGDWRIPTEHRPSPPQMRVGDEIVFAPDFKARVIRESGLSGRLLDLEFNLSGEELWHAIYVHGKLVQYSYMNDALDLWSVQNVYSGRPWAVEMPSAGHALTWQMLLRLQAKGIGVAQLTHGAGLSSTGDQDIDRALPLPERFDIPPSTEEAVRTTRARDGRVIAVGTSVVRALESADRGSSGITDLKIGPEHRLRNVDGLLTGTHEMSETHYQLLKAFLPELLLKRISRHLESHEYLTHEFGDLCLIIAK